MCAFRGGPEKVKPAAFYFPRGVYAFNGLAKVVRARVVGGMGLDSKFPMVYRQEVNLHAHFLGSMHDAGGLAACAAEHVNDVIGFLQLPGSF